MLQRILVFGLLGPLALIGSCASEQPAGSNSSATPAAGTTQATDQTKADKAAPTKQVTLSVSGMT